jgi:hypothetical protein
VKIIIRDNVRHNSVSYKVLNYAMFKSRIGDGTFSVNDYLNFCLRMYKPSDVKRAVVSLIRHGHLRKLKTGQFMFVQTNVIAKLNNAYNQTQWSKQRNMGNKEEENASY